MEKKASEIIETIIKDTLTRHSGLTTEDYFKALGIDTTDLTDLPYYEKVLNEFRENRNIKVKLIMELTKEILKANDKTKLITQTIMLGTGVTEEELQKEKEKNNNG